MSRRCQKRAAARSMGRMRNLSTSSSTAVRPAPGGSGSPPERGRTPGRPGDIAAGSRAAAAASRRSGRRRCCRGRRRPPAARHRRGGQCRAISRWPTVSMGRSRLRRRSPRVAQRKSQATPRPRPMKTASRMTTQAAAMGLGHQRIPGALEFGRHLRNDGGQRGEMIADGGETAWQEGPAPWLACRLAAAGSAALAACCALIHSWTCGSPRRSSSSWILAGWSAAGGAAAGGKRPAAESRDRAGAAAGRAASGKRARAARCDFAGPYRDPPDRSFRRYWWLQYRAGRCVSAPGNLRVGVKERIYRGGSGGRGEARTALSDASFPRKRESQA